MLLPFIAISALIGGTYGVISGHRFNQRMNRLRPVIFDHTSQQWLDSETGLPLDDSHRA